MPYLPLLLTLILCTCGRAQLQAQPQADPIRTVRNVAPITNAFSKKWRNLNMSRDSEGARFSDSIALAVVGQEVTASYLVDRHGNVWNLGVMELPFVVYTFMNRSSNIVPHIAAINTVADEYADEMVTFLLLPSLSEPDATRLLEGFNDNVVIVFDDHLRTPYHSSEESCIWGLTHNWPTTYFITAKRRIVGLQTSVYAYIQPQRELTKINRKFARNRTKSLRKQIEQLLKHD